MDDLESVSLTRGYYVHKPGALKKKKIGSSKATYVDMKENILWPDINKKIENIVEKSYIETLDGIVQFIESCIQSHKITPEEVPAAVLVMGVNMSDHSNLFHFLEKHLHSNEIYGTVILESRNCSNMSSMLQVILNEISVKYEEVLPSSCVLKKQECSFSKLLEYYQQICEKISSPTKKRDLVKHGKRRSFSKSIVLLIQDVESFNPEILQELILLCKIYLEKLPIVLVFGMVSAMVTLHSILPQKALCCLGVETFYSVPATDYLTRIIEEVIISPNQPFKLGPRLFRLVVDTVLYHDFSVTNLTYLLKFALLEHLYDKNVSMLCCRQEDVEEVVKEISNKDLQTIKKLPSIKKYLENNPKFLSCLDNATIFKESIVGFLLNVFHHHRMTLFRLRLLHCFVKDLPGYPLGKQIRELYSLSLEKEVFLTKEFSEAQKLLKMQSQESLMSKLEACLTVLKDPKEKSSYVSDIRSLIEESMEKISTLTSGDFEKNMSESMFLQNDKITSRFQLQEKIQMSIKLKRSNFDILRNEIIEKFMLIFKNITPPSNLPLYEVFYFDDVSSVKRHLMAVPRVASGFSLNNPNYHLKCSCCKISISEETQPAMPDICILYKLHLESGKLINLYDWLEAFKAIKNGPSNTAKKSRTKKGDVKTDNDLHILFLQAVSELQLLGFIKPTKRKTDHVARLTFGSF